MCETIGQHNDVIKSKMAVRGKLKRVAFSVFDQYEMLCLIKFVIRTLFWSTYLTSTCFNSRDSLNEERSHCSLPICHDNKYYVSYLALLITCSQHYIPSHCTSMVKFSMTSDLDRAESTSSATSTMEIVCWALQIK